MIKLSKRYTTVDGRQVDLHKIYDQGEFVVHGAILNNNNRWDSSSWGISGRNIGNIDRLNNDMDLIEVSKYYDFTDGEPVIVWNNDLPSITYQRYFLREYIGTPITYDSGYTPWVINGYHGGVQWDNCRKLNPHEQAMYEEKTFHFYR